MYFSVDFLKRMRKAKRKAKRKANTDGSVREEPRTRGGNVAPKIPGAGLSNRPGRSDVHPMDVQPHFSFKFFPQYFDRMAGLSIPLTPPAPGSETAPSPLPPHPPPRGRRLAAVGEDQRHPRGGEARATALGCRGGCWGIAFRPAANSRSAPNPSLIHNTTLICCILIDVSIFSPMHRNPNYKLIFVEFIVSFLKNHIVR